MTEEFLRKKASEVFWLSVLLGLPFLIWLYAIPSELNKRLPRENRIPSLLFQIPFFYALAYIPIGFILIISINVSFEVILPFHFGAMASIFLVLTVACVSIIRFEKYKKIKTSNGIGLFFGMWYYIFGIWSIQPKLNNYVKTPPIDN
jgi:hypothetical protein